MDRPPESLQFRRDQHLFGPGPKRLLALDGGGVRGAISLAFLAEMETLLRDRNGPDSTLGNWFDLIGGTSTGAIIAAALALGHRTEQIEDFYRNRAQLVFRRSISRIPGLRSRFDASALMAEIERVVGDRTLETTDLLTGFALVMKRIDTGSPWIVANNPRAPYWNENQGRSHTGNRLYRLADLIRASTAAPLYFDPELISIHESQPGALFVDGGLTPYHNPSFILFMMTTLRAYKICWPTGVDNLTIVSIGTGGYRSTLLHPQLRFMAPARLAFHSLMSLMHDTQSDALMLMQWLGESLTPWPINREVGTLADEIMPGGRLFKFVRYDVRLEMDWLAENFDQPISTRQLAKLREMADPANIALAHEIGRQAARRQVKPEHFGL
jgi:hypothetical protein